MAEVTELNNKYSTIENKNMDGKMSIYLRTKRFPEYAGSF